MSETQPATQGRSRFHVVIRATPNTQLSTRGISLADREIESYVVPPELQSTPLSVSFESAVERLESFSRMFVEPDGSFVWVSSSDEQPAWQVDGNLYDRDGSLIAVDVKGTCSQMHLVQLFDVFRTAGRELMIEVVWDAIFIRERDFLDLLLTEAK